jgi:hypothetical protein
MDPLVLARTRTALELPLAVVTGETYPVEAPGTRSSVQAGRRMVVSTCTEDTNFDTHLAVYSSSGDQCNDLSCITWRDNDGACSLHLYATSIYFDSTEGTTYYIAIVGEKRSVGSFGVYVADSVSGCDDPASLSLTADGSVTTGTNENGSRTSFGSCDGGDVSGRSSWYSFVGTGQRMVVSTCTEDTNFDTHLAVYSSSGDQCNDLSSIT